jgi:hypothetical protein
MRVWCTIGLAVLCSGCVTTEAVRFQPKPQQEALIRDGNPGIVSRKKSSIVIVRPAAREFQPGGRPVFVVGMTNVGRSPLEFRVADVQAEQRVGDQAHGLKVITYEELVSEERNRQIAAAIITGIVAGANAAAASQQGYYNSTSTVYGPRGTYQVNTSGYSPTAAAIAQTRAAVQNDAMIAATVEQGQRNMATLEQAVIKDNTVLPGEWYGGQLHLQPPSSDAGPLKNYVITVQVGPDRHEIDVMQATPDTLSKVRTASVVSYHE